MPNNFNPFMGNFYLQDLQAMKDRIDRTMQNYKNQYMQPQQQAPITQNFQITPQQNQSELQSAYVNGIDEVKNTFVIKNGIFVNRDLTNLWFKDVTGNIKTYSLSEVIELDEKDKALQDKDNEINSLKQEIIELKGAINYANEQYAKPITSSVEGTSKSKSSKVSRSKSVDAE